MSVAAELSVEGVLNTIARGLAGKILGVLALFSREYLSEQDSTWIGIFAKQAAVAIANARAFEEIARLRKQLEIENANLHEQMKESFAFGEIVVDAARCDLAFADYHSGRHRIIAARNGSSRARQYTGCSRKNSGKDLWIWWRR